MTFKIIDFGLGRFDEYYAADEGADVNLDVSDGQKTGPWYLAPFAWCGSAPEKVHQAAWRGKGALVGFSGCCDLKPLCCGPCFLLTMADGQQQQQQQAE